MAYENATILTDNPNEGDTTDTADAATKATGAIVEELRKASERVFSAARESSQFGTDLATNWFETVGKVTPSIPAPLAASRKDVEELVQAGFGLAQDTLNLQRELVSAFVEAAFTKTASR